jgi:hypothetical protein
MSYTHSLLVTQASRPSRLLGTQPSEQRGYVVDSGVMPSTLAPLVSILRGINLNKPDGSLDTEGPLDALLEELEADFASAGGEESVTFIATSFVRDIAEIPDSQIPRIAGQWVELEEEIGAHPEKSADDILRDLTRACRAARDSARTLAIHSTE